MNDLLFSVEESHPSALQVARARLAAAQEAYNRASEWEDESGEPMPGDVSRELRFAERDVARAERDAMFAARHTNESPGPHVAESDQ